MPTVVTYCTPDFSHFLEGLRDDCARLGYRFYHEQTETKYANLIHAFDHKIGFLRRMVDEFGCVLWLDVECRLLKPIPAAWQAPLITSYSINDDVGLSSGVLLLDERQRDFLAIWERYAKKYPKYPDDFVLDFLTEALPYPFNTVPFEFHDQTTCDPVVRGQWSNEHTIVQHPTINRWPDPMKYRRAFIGGANNKGGDKAADSVARQRKHLFFRNFGGSFEDVLDIMQSGSDQPATIDGWVFLPRQLRYAPESYWPEFADDFNVKPFTYEKSIAYFNKPTAGNRYRDQVKKKMKLDRADCPATAGSSWQMLTTLLSKLRIRVGS